MPPLPSPSFDPTPYLVGLAALVTAVGTVLTQWHRTTDRVSRKYRRAFHELQRRYNIALLHIYELERGYSARGQLPPLRPPELDEVVSNDAGIEDPPAP